MQIIGAAGEWVAPVEGQPNRYDEHFRTADLSVGTYCIRPARSTTSYRTPKTRSTW